MYGEWCMLKPFTSLVITVRIEILVILYVNLNSPPNTYFLVMITECVCYQDKVSPRFHIPGILSEDHASPCKTIHILGGGDPGQQAGSSFTKALPRPLFADEISEQLPLSIITIQWHNCFNIHAPPMLYPAYWKCFDYSIIISDINLVLRNCNCKFTLRLPHITKSILLLQVWSYKRFYHSLEFFFNLYVSVINHPLQ